jgi:hypothetical protein
MSIEDLHNKGTFNNLTEVWLKIPNGGNSEKDYITVNGAVCYWSFSANNWVSADTSGTIVDNTEVIENSVDIKKDLSVEGNTKLNNLTLNDKDIFDLFLAKNSAGTFAEIINFLKGITFSDGASILKDANNKWHLVIDDTTVNGKKIADVIRTNDTVDASDINIFSALEALSKFLRTDAECTANKRITFLKGINFSDGSSIYLDSDGSWHMSIATIEAKKLIVDELDSKTTTNINGKAISDVVRSTDDDTSPSDTDVFSALRTEKEIQAIIEKSTDSLDLSDTKVISAEKANNIFARKDIADAFAEDMTFNKGVQIVGTANIGNENVTGKSTINEADITTLNATNGTFSTMMKAAAATIVGIAAIGTVNATTLNADTGTIPTLNATTCTVSQTLNAGAAQITADLAVGGKVTTLNAVVNNLASTYQLSVSDTATILRTIVKDYISSDTYIPGFSGSGFKLWNNGGWNLELDTLTVRKVMNIFELIINKIRSVNGGLIVSPGNGKISSVSLANSVYTLGIEGDMTFVANDLVRCQTFRTTGSKYYWVQVQSVTGNNITVNQSDFGTTVPEVGDELVQMGNTTDTSRQGCLYLVANEDGKPRIEVLNGISSTDLTGKVKAIFGDLDGITDTDFTSISGYGLYAQNVYLKGSFVLKSGKTVETALSDTQTAAAGDATTKANSALGSAKNYSDANLSTANSNAQGYANDAYSNAKTYIDGNYVTQSTYTAEVKVLTDSISAKVSQTDFNSLGTRVSTAETNITANANAITSKVSSTDYTGATIASLINQSATGVTIEAAHINLAGAVTITDFNSTVTAAALGGATPTDVSTAVNNIQVGGTNLFSGTKDLSGLNTGGGALISNDYLGFTSVSCSTWQNRDFILESSIPNLKINQYYTLSFYAKSTVTGDKLTSYFWPNLDGQEGDGRTQMNLTTDWERYSVTWLRLNAEAVNIIVGRLVTSGGTGTVSVCGVKLEEGNKATSWSPAPEDVSQDATDKANTAYTNAKSYVDNNYVTQTTYTTEIGVLDNAISAKVAQTDFDSLGTRVSTAETNITANANAITSKVSSTDYTGATIASLINQSATGVTIEAAHINLAGAVTITDFNSTVTAAALGGATPTDVSTAQSNAEGYTDSLKNSLGSLAYKAAVSAAMLDTTVINGGCILTSLLDVKTIVANGIYANTINAGNATFENITMTSATVTGNITANSGAIGKWTINSNGSITTKDNNLAMLGAYFTNGSLVEISDYTYGLVYANSTGNITAGCFVAQGSAGVALSAQAVDSNGSAFVCTGNCDFFTNYDSQFVHVIGNFKVNSEYCDIYLHNGGTLTLSNSSCSFIFCSANSTVYLPASPTVGKIFNIVRGGHFNVYVNGNGHNICSYNGNSGSGRNLTSDYQWDKYIYIAGAWLCEMGYS